MAEKRGWIGVDLDGTLAEHYWPQKGPYDPLRIGDPVPAMVVIVREHLAAGWEVRVFTARVEKNMYQETLPVRTAIREWTREHIGTALDATCVKDYAMVLLYDDRARQVVPNTGRVAGCCACLNPTPALDLPPRLRDVLALVAEGLTNRAIGARLDLSEKTIKNHVTRLLEHFAVESRTGLVRIALRAGLA